MSILYHPLVYRLPTRQVTDQGPANNQAVGAILPEALNPESWTASGTELQKEGEAEIHAAKTKEEMGAVVDSAAGKLKS